MILVRRRHFLLFGRERSLSGSGNQAFWRICAGAAMSDVSCETAPVDLPFALPPESIEIIIDLPPPPSVNRIWRACRGRIFKSKEYMAWQKECDAVIVLNRQYPRDNKIIGPFEFCLYLSRAGCNGDGDNRIKALLDWLQSREIIRNDVDCQKGYWEWVPAREAPLGVRVHLRSLHG